jgi:hypothetical protein
MAPSPARTITLAYDAVPTDDLRGPTPGHHAACGDSPSGVQRLQLAGTGTVALPDDQFQRAVSWQAGGGHL